MGSPKQLLPWGGKPLIAYHVEELHASGIERTIVVLGHRSDEVRAVIAGADVEIVVNADYLRGRATSVVAGANAVPDGALAVMTISVDQPRPRDLLAALLEWQSAGQALITLPTYRGRRGHPPVFSGKLIGELRTVSEERQGLREVVQRHASEIGEIPWDSDIVLMGMNTPEEYERALANYPFAPR